tara:strand:- start:91 stop:849 length:759 start_codon:yes stop_codon:yes gene_type:complete
MITYSKELIDLISVRGLFKKNKDGKYLLGKHDSKTKRENIVKKLMNLTGCKEKPEKHSMYKSSTSDFEIFVEKPGKEAYREKNTNEYDLRIYIENDGKEISELGKAFTDIFKTLENIKEHTKALDLIAYVLIRNAFCFDHNDSNEYCPSMILINEIKNDIDKIHSLPIDIFFQFLDLIAANEDVKYSNKGASMGTGTGRRNNLLTYVNVIALLQGKIQTWELIGALTSGAAGVAQIGPDSIHKYFPHIDGKK